MSRTLWSARPAACGSMFKRMPGRTPPARSCPPGTKPATGPIPRPQAIGSPAPTPPRWCLPLMQARVAQLEPQLLEPRHRAWRQWSPTIPTAVVSDESWPPESAQLKLIRKLPGRRLLSLLTARCRAALISRRNRLGGGSGLTFSVLGCGCYGSTLLPTRPAAVLCVASRVASEVVVSVAVGDSAEGAVSSDVPPHAETINNPKTSAATRNVFHMRILYITEIRSERLRATEPCHAVECARRN